MVLAGAGSRTPASRSSQGGPSVLCFCLQRAQRCHSCGHQLQGGPRPLTSSLPIHREQPPRGFSRLNQKTGSACWVWLWPKGGAGHQVWVITIICVTITVIVTGAF